MLFALIKKRYFRMRRL